jgi:hypothetical protein
MIENNYTKSEKKDIEKQLGEISDDDAIDDFFKLRNITCKKSKEKLLSNIGIDIINKFTRLERLNTRGRNGFSFFDIYYNRKKLIKKEYIRRLFYDYYKIKDINDVKTWKNIQSFYFGSVNIFRPIIAMDIYCRFNPHTVLDMTMGWGGRLVGACAINVPHYIGIDYNNELKKPYEKLTKLLTPLCNTKIELYFEDAIKFNYSKHKYDLVLTSPPYYNIETYSGQLKKSKDEWDEYFYKPLIINSFDGLSHGGYYCLNVPNEVYKRILLPLLGRPYKKIQLAKYYRKDPNTTKKEYGEYIYIWHKI